VRFDTPDYQLAAGGEQVPAGFDQPLLHTMYIDNDSMACRGAALSRLNG